MPSPWRCAIPVALELAHRPVPRSAPFHRGALLALALCFAASCEKSTSINGPSSTVTRLIISPTAVTLQPNQAQDFTAVGFTAAGDTAQIAVSWSTTGGTLDTSSAGGRHYGHFHSASCGRFTVTATSHPGNWTASAQVTVACAVATVTISPAAINLQSGQMAQLTATLKDANGTVVTGRTVTWSSNHDSVATVSATGLVTATSVGTATITATSDGHSGTASVTVSITPVASVTVSPATASLVVAQTVQLTATPRDANGNSLIGRPVTWTTSDGTTASVSGSGLVTGVAVGGPVTITATSEGQSGTSAVTVKASTGGVAFDHVFIVVEENNDYTSVTNSSMPYLTGLAAQYGLATQYYANTHPSIGNYFELTSGQIVTNSDSYSQTVNVDNVVRHLVAAGKSWKSYAEGLPSVGFVNLGYNDGTYASKHNTIVYFTDVHDDTAQAKNVVPFTQFATDLANGTLPNYSFIVPDLCNDAHDCSLKTADTWLQQNIDPLIQSAFFRQNNCLLIITFDESGGDNTHGGGRVYWVAVSPKSKPGYQSTTLYQHQSTLRLMLQGLGLTSFPGDAVTAPDMSEFFNP